MLIDLVVPSHLQAFRKFVLYHSDGRGPFKEPTCQATMRPHLSTGPFPSNLTHSGPFDPELIKRVPWVPTWAGRKPQHWRLCALLLIPSIRTKHSSERPWHWGHATWGPPLLLQLLGVTHHSSLYRKRPLVCGSRYCQALQDTGNVRDCFNIQVSPRDQHECSPKSYLMPIPGLL